MNIYTLNLLIAALAVGVTIIASLVQKPQNWFAAYVRYFLGTFFVFSGVVKAIDPIGTAIKMEEYFTIFTEYMPFLEGFWSLLAGLALPISIFMIVLEIGLGIAMILGVFRMPTLYLYLGLIGFFTILTGFSHLTGKVTDCGCFGDFVKLKPFESFIKDLILTILVVLMFSMKKHIIPLFKSKLGFGTVLLASLLSLVFCLRNYYDLPIKDFRAYKVGADLNNGRNDGTDGEIKMIYTLNNAAGETKKIDSDEYMSSGIWKDKSWTIDKDKTVKEVIEEPKLPTIKDFMVFDVNENDIADSLVTRGGFQFFVAAQNVKKLNNAGFGAVNQVMAAAKKDGVIANGLTASSLEDAAKMNNGAYPWNTLDATPIKTMIRANPGVVLVKDGIVVDKWHGAHLPTWASIKAKHKIK